MSLCVAVLGATGAVGRTMLRVLEERSFPVGELRLLASERSTGVRIEYRGQAHPVAVPDEDAFRGVHLVLVASGNDLSERWTPVALRMGARVVDNSSAFRMHDDVPLVVPEVNGERLSARPRLVANPNCCAVPLAMALAPLRGAGLTRVVVATYQSISGGGAEALARFERELDSPTAARGADDPPPLAFNVIPMIDRLEANGYTHEEMKIARETRKILDLPELPITVTSVRVPVRVGHSHAVNVTAERALTPDEARDLWRASAGIRVLDDPEHGRLPMPVDVAGTDDVVVGRVRRDLSHPGGLDFWVVADNLRKGAATNAVQIAEQLTRAEVASR